MPEKKDYGRVSKEVDKCFLGLIIHLFVLSHFFFFNQQKIIDLRKASWPKFCFIICFFLLKVGSVGPVDQQINFVLPEVFQLKFIFDHFQITIIHKGTFLIGASLVHFIWKCS